MQEAEGLRKKLSIAEAAAKAMEQQQLGATDQLLELEAQVTAVTLSSCIMCNSCTI